MDVGFTKSKNSHPLHWIMGSIVVTIGYSLAMFWVRSIVMG